jgi:hypothetical protein
VAAVVRGLDGLLLDAIASHHPHDERELGLEIGVAGDADGLGGEDRLAAAGRQAKTDVGHVRQRGERTVGGRALRCLPGEGFGGTGGAGDLEEAAEGGEGLALVGLELHFRPAP